MTDVIVITGATGKLGQNIVRGLQGKYKIILLCRNTGKANALFDSELNLDIIECDLKKREAIDLACDEISRRYKSIKGIINNAALDIDQPFEETSQEELEEIFKVNVYAPYYLCRGLAGLLKKSNGASIVNISSNLATRSIKNATEYSMTKAAVESLSRSIAVEYGRYNIRCNTLVIGGMPGIMTKVGQDIVFSKDELDYSDCKVSLDKIPLGRQGLFKEYVKAIDFLLCEDSSYITGGLVRVDGGISIYG